MDDERTHRRADLILEVMGEAQTIMTAGPRDFGPTPGVLRERAAAHGVTVVSANLVGPDGKKVFPASTIRTVGTLKVAVIGVSPEGDVFASPGYRGEPEMAAVMAEVGKVRAQADLVVLLAATSIDRARIVGQVEGIDLVLASGDRRAIGRVGEASPVL